MAYLRRDVILGRLNQLGYRALESAIHLCELRGNKYVELVHWVNQILVLPDSDVHRILAAFELNAGQVASDVVRSLDRLPRITSSVLDISPVVDEAVQEGFLYASLHLKESQIRTGCVLAGALTSDRVRGELEKISPEFRKISADRLVEELPKLLQGSVEDGMRAMDAGVTGTVPEPGDDRADPGRAVLGRGEALARFAEDLTALAREGRFPPIIGRDAEIDRCIEILLRSTQNNPMLVGEPGVGKTAVAEGLAQRLVAGPVPPQIKGSALWSLDLGALQAGSGIQGEFEKRLKQVIQDVRTSPTPVILFIDEAHLILGAGKGGGQMDAGNLLKPALARGELRTIGATTWAEYQKYFETDAALTRRFTTVRVNEPTDEATVHMLRGRVSKLEKAHTVVITDESLLAAVKLGRRYIAARQHPDKAISLLDTACARVSMSQHGAPRRVSDLEREIEMLRAELGSLDREILTGTDHAKRRGEAMSRLEAALAQLESLSAHWREEAEIVRAVQRARDAVWAAAAGGPEQAAAGASDAALSELKQLQERLKLKQGDAPLVLPSVDQHAVTAVISDWTGIPVGRMVRNEIDAILTLADTMERRVIGQRHALDSIAERIRISRTPGLGNPGKPIGVFLLVGPSGVGKTETAVSLAEALYGGEQNMVVLNMSEYQADFTVSRIMGPPPGYVGHEAGGVLSNAIQRKPFSVVLLDEFEKAHRDVHELFFQVFDKGALQDGRGRDTDFKNTIIIVTTNVASDRILTLCRDPSLIPEPGALAEAIRDSLRQAFPDALLARMTIVPYFPMSQETLRAIARLQLERIRDRWGASSSVQFSFDSTIEDMIVSRCQQAESGARIIESIITSNILPELSREFLKRLGSGQELQRVHILADGTRPVYEFS